MDRHATLLTAMANANRLKILTKLVGSEFTVGNLAQEVGLSQSALSQHLAKLRSAKLVNTRRDAQTIYYSSNSDAVKAILAALEHVSAASEEQRQQQAAQSRRA